MAKFNIKIEGIELVAARIKKLNGYEPYVKRCVLKSLAEMKERSEQITPRDSGYLKNSAFGELNSNLSGVFGFTAKYAPHVEYGHRIVRGGRQVGYVSGRGFLKRNAQQQKKIFREDCKKVMEELTR